MRVNRGFRHKQFVNKFERSLRAGQALSEVYSLLGYPDEVGMASIPAGSAGYRVRVNVSQAIIELAYKDVGTIRFVSPAGQPDWVIESASSTTGQFWSRYNGRFMSLKDQIAKGNGDELHEVAQFLLAGNLLEKDVAAAIIARVNSGVPDPGNSELADGLVSISKALMEKGNAADEKNLVVYLLAHGNGRQLRGVAVHLLGKGAIEPDVLDVAMARICSSRDTQDDYLVDGLDWLCKVMSKSGNASYKEQLVEISNTAELKSLRKYAGKAAEAL